MASVSGRRKSLSPPRRLICDLLRASSKIPIITFERRMDLSPVVAARACVSRAPSWALLFVKAFGLVAARRQELRRAYLPLPWPHLWEADASSASVAVEREYQGEPCVFFGLVTSPETRPLSELMEKLEDWRTKPVHEISNFRRSLRYASYPLLARRFLWWYATSWFGKVKARNFGTFGVSLTGASGATATNLICPLTTSLNCGVIQPDGTVDVRLHFDHRVMDGMPAARALAELEEVLRTEIVAEMLNETVTRAVEVGV
ncbi:MAG: 2-oxo acid dehydrogenase subunit E2 [Planctomycetes bacterium]|nr:2-oxo acid dehydrogenase subunit E2 [Planctomycetota bacterium]